jgi:hypothetical protein
MLPGWPRRADDQAGDVGLVGEGFSGGGPSAATR